MQLGRRRGVKGATAVAVAVIGGLLGGAHGAFAAPSNPEPDPGAPAATKPDRESDAAVPSVWPRPQSIRAAGQSVRVSEEAVLVAEAGTDPYAMKAFEGVLRDAGVKTLYTVRPDEPLPLPARGLVVRAGGAGANDALRALRAPESADLPSGGYRIAVGSVGGRDTVALDGIGDDGLFHAAQTLRQLVTGPDSGDQGKRIAGVVVRDWPGTAVRGMTEGFYGQPWTREQRLAQVDFMARTKQNRYLYAPGDDPYRQARWRDPYPADQRAGFRALAERARSSHVTLGWAVAPGQALCMSSDDDIRALNRKFDAMWALGVRSFQLQFQDVSYSEWHCGADADTFGSGPQAAAKAHARVANAVARHLAERHPGSEPLSMMPTEFYQEGDTDYRQALAAELDGGVHVAWTGVGVVPRTITGRELAGARDAFRHPLVTMDNYPVNDYAQDRIFLGPYQGREPAVATGSSALLANAMEQASASRIPLFTSADYAWNPRGYQPQESWQAAMDDLAGGDATAREAMRALAGNDASSVLGGEESAYLRPLIDGFWRARTSGDQGVRDTAAKKLRDAFTVMREAPLRLQGSAGGAFDDEVRPWTEQLARYGRAGELSVDLLQAQARGDGPAAWRASLDLEALRGSLKASRVTVGKGVLDPFLAKAVKAADAWTGADRKAGSVAEDAGSYTVRLDRARPVEALTAMTEPGTGEGAAVEAHVQGQGWRRVGTLSGTGWTQTDAGGARVDAVRLRWDAAGDGGAPVVHRVVPWFADEPRAGLRLERSETDAEIGGSRPERVTVRLTGQRPAEVRGRLTAEAPKGIEVRAPLATTVPRGASTAVPLDVRVDKAVRAGEYKVPVSFDGQDSVLTVRAFPRTGGPDLVRGQGARVSSSGDETADFPATNAADGDPSTRWTSPIGRSAWWQTELAEPVRLGQVVLHWQEAYAKKYRIQVSQDGRTWRTAATVRDGQGGREAVRMDAEGVRFVRVQCDERALPFGYSLFGVEAYAVADTD
ncbi:beta-N-acetylglucosaminidase domain-containing protein [Streptomyces sp. ISL-96]|uniref:beta-N-acetylglucosaminidase domain-containing protein n=1 Tax=Streptomyces sp. ISL-96 TaxID=2819191 RepID=UPI001BE8125D|nr:beta-N-acetylglucosaminidase domain-containing protein [Streptomyces sp. ISL-96]MBT2493580.1 beta-N-acetylglucosaminidase domain-containing protein [Streptomyces sp. ISL-96]